MCLRSRKRRRATASVPHSGVRSSGFENDSELRALFERTYGPVRDRGFEALQQSRKKAETLEQLYVTRIRQDDYLLVDGYNIILRGTSWKAIAAEDVNAARERLCEYHEQLPGCAQVPPDPRVRCLQGQRAAQARSKKRHGIHIVYTREAETADMYIEQASYDLSRGIACASLPDGMEQMIILGHGAGVCLRLS